MSHLPAVLRSIAADLNVAGPQYAGMSQTLQQAAAGMDALVWIASQPIMGPAATWWDMRAKAREALGLPPIMLTPEEKARNAAGDRDSRPAPAAVCVVDGDTIPGVACANCED